MYDNSAFHKEMQEKINQARLKDELEFLERRAKRLKELLEQEYRITKLFSTEVEEVKV